MLNLNTHRIPVSFEIRKLSHILTGVLRICGAHNVVLMP